MTVWGNHSATQYPDIFHARIGGRPAAEVVADQAWLENEFIPTVQKRGAAIIEARGASSAASAANAAIDHVRDWVTGTPARRLGLDGGALGRLLRGARGRSSAASRCGPRTAPYTIVEGLEIDDFSRARIDASVAELVEERDAVRELGLFRCAGGSAAGGRRARAAAAARRGPAVSSALGVPAAVALDDLAVLLEAGQDAVEVVLLDPHRACDLGDRDTWLGLHQLERLQRARAGSARAAAAAGAARLRVRLRAARRGAAARAGARAAARVGARKPGERGGGRLELTVLLDQRLQLAQPCGDLLTLRLQKSLTDIPRSLHRSLTVRQVATNR